MTYYDFNIRSRSSREKDRQHIIKRSCELGYSTAVWTSQTFGKLNNNNGQLKPPKAVELDLILLKDLIKQRSFIDSYSTSSPNNFRQLNRLTLAIDDVADAQILTAGNEQLKSFDIIAVIPGSAKVFSYLCKQAEIDIIAFDFTHRLPFPLNKKLLDEAIKRCIFFEIAYSPLFSTPLNRRQIFTNTSLLIKYTTGKNIILSSGAETVSQLRGPLDVINIGVCLGLTIQQATKTISENGALLIKHAKSRKLRYLPIEVINREEYLQRFPEISLDNIRPNELSDKPRTPSLPSLPDIETQESSDSLHFKIKDDEYVEDCNEEENQSSTLDIYQNSSDNNNNNNNNNNKYIDGSEVGNNELSQETPVIKSQLSLLDMKISETINEAGTISDELKINFESIPAARMTSSTSHDVVSNNNEITGRGSNLIVSCSHTTTTTTLECNTSSTSSRNNHDDDDLMNPFGASLDFVRFDDNITNNDDITTGSPHDDSEKEDEDEVLVENISFIVGHDKGEHNDAKSLGFSSTSEKRVRGNKLNKLSNKITGIPNKKRHLRNIRNSLSKRIKN